MEKRCPTCAEAAAIVKEWAEKQGHERCWYYPDLFRRLVSLLGIKINTDPKLPPRAEFEEGCRRFQEEEYGN